ncbi:hypothetical protein SERLA73DRAFT_90145 [Serpula lacrymans var. lacrymans S7.3]|uniref:Homeobox domain-containing protein n=2 Tax=Serpula lacrymans var. lacrymans TaxID=341189 RepID=F8PYN7_SERL3|nr:hypothetical protein SERLA73DRAFT_90145 [Serpula lacrymans var. lacrymans S7.3]
MVQESYSMLEPQTKHDSLHLNSGACAQDIEVDPNPDSSASSPSSSVHSPITPVIIRPSSASATSDGREPEIAKDPASGPQRARSTGAASSKGDKEKRKRSRVTPEQLVHLERFFSVDRSPTAGRRKEISELLGMQERQTQIWFQNRRAKAKLQDGKKGRGGSIDTPPDTPPELSTGYEAELHTLIHEDEPVTIIPCTDLSIGTWRRIATTVGKHDLVAYLCDSKRCLTWFIHSSGYGFKMEIPFDIIVDTEFTNAAPGSGLASFILSQPPTFYLENFTSPLSSQGRDPIRQWKRCADWTEGQQATKILRHDLIGSAVQLAHVLRHLNAHTSGSDIRLHNPSYHPGEEAAPVLDIPQPPLVALTGPGYHYQGEALDSQSSSHLTNDRKRSYSGPTIIQNHASQHESTFPSIVVDSSGSTQQGSSSAFTPSFSPYSGRPHSIQRNHSPMFTDFPGVEQHNVSSHAHSSLDYGAMSLPRSGASRSYPVPPMTRPLFGEDMRIVSSYHAEGHSPTSTGFSQPSFHTPSPPLLTTPFHPSQSISVSRGADTLESSMVTMSGMPGVTYESDDDVRR